MRGDQLVGERLLAYRGLGERHGDAGDVALESGERRIEPALAAGAGQRLDLRPQCRRLPRARLGEGTRAREFRRKQFRALAGLPCGDGQRFGVGAVVPELACEPRRDRLQQRRVGGLRERLHGAPRVGARGELGELPVACLERGVDSRRQRARARGARLAATLQVRADRRQRRLAFRAVHPQREPRVRHHVREHTRRGVEQAIVGDERARHAARAGFRLDEVVEPQRERLLRCHGIAPREGGGDLDRSADHQHGGHVEVGGRQPLAPERRREREPRIVQHDVRRVAELGGDQRVGVGREGAYRRPLEPAVGRRHQRVPAQAEQREEALVERDQRRTLPAVVRLARWRYDEFPAGHGTGADQPAGQRGGPAAGAGQEEKGVAAHGWGGPVRAGNHRARTNMSVCAHERTLTLVSPIRFHIREACASRTVPRPAAGTAPLPEEARCLAGAAERDAAGEE